MRQQSEAEPRNDMRQDTTEPQLGHPRNEAVGEEAENTGVTEPVDEAERLRAELDAQKAEHAAMHDKFVRLHAEFDNFRKRTAKERMELLMSAGADTIKSVLPILDDMERAIAHNAEAGDIESVKQGFVLIQQK
ncbi:MAG: nucleotide exchange factor GrpE, partial [Bacteroidetes bacterium]|nr:nucleotide exchange factor GrpE [Bacteroidota bacterium]